jgi:hypothetical protein
MTIETTCAVIIPEGYASVEAYLAAHEKSKAELHHKRTNDFCRTRLAATSLAAPRTSGFATNPRSLLGARARRLFRRSRFRFTS